MNESVNMKATWFRAGLLALVGVVFCVVSAFGQTTEVCNDGVDNNGDGKIDCADALCTFAPTVEKGCNCYDGKDNDGDGKIDSGDTDCAVYYGLTFVGAGSTCSINPPPGTAFTSIAPPRTSSQNTADTPAKIAIGDMNNDGVPDVVVTSKWNQTLQVVATATVSGFTPGDIMGDYKTTSPGSIFPNPKSSFYFENEILIADIDKNKIGEAFGIVSKRGGGPNTVPTAYYLVGFKYAAGTLIPLFNPVLLGSDRPGSPGIADFDGDGKAEIYIKNRIYAAESGVLLADPGGNWKTAINSGPVAANILGDNKLELVCGNFIYTVPSLASRTLQVLTVAKDMNTISAVKYYPKGFFDPTEYGADHASTTSTADFDGDGFLDVLITGAINCSGNEAVPCGNNVTTVFYWNVNKGTVKTYAPPDATTPATGWAWGTGRINMGDANGDGKLEALFIAGNQLYCMGLDAGGNLTVLWTRTINDSLSGILSLTVYDFDNDGKPEVVYRDSQELAIVDGPTGVTKLWSSPCNSHTWTEGPVIADANGDGSTDICVPCYTSNAFDINKATVQQQSLGQTRFYFSNTNSWLPTRKVWNQHPYYVTNINDNLTLPFPQIDPSLIFSNAPCPTGLPGPQRPLNLFMNQVPRLSASGCPEFPAPDLTYFGDDPSTPGVDSNGDGVYSPTVVVTPPICGNLDIKVNFNIINNGDLPITDVVPVSFFNGDPTANPVTATKLFNTTLNIANLQIGQKLLTPTITFNGPGTAFTLYIVLYNDGSSLPISLAGSSTKECSISNNMYSVLVTPSPFTTTIEKVSDNFKCLNAAPDTGELRAHIFKAGVEVFDYSPYAFQWYNGAGTTSPIAAPAGTSFDLSGRAEGTYTLVVTDKLKGCASTPIQMTLVRLGNDPTINLTVVSHQTQCNPANGQIQADIVGGNTGYTFTWYDIALNPLGITGNIANGLVAGNYLVSVSKSGCTKLSSPVVINGPQIPDAQAAVTQNVVDCSAPNSGAVKADALFNGVIQNPANYTFDWYFYNNLTSTRGSILPPANGVGQSRTGLAVGYYQAVVTDNTTKCIAGVAPIVQVQSQTVVPTAQITQVAPQTSCDPANPNGILTGDALVGGIVQNPSSFTFQWFKGDNTLPANLVATTSGINGQTVNKVAGGGVYYTVKVTSALNCSATAKFIIAETLNVPVVTLTPVNNSICNPALAASTYNGAVSAAVTFAGSPVTAFGNYSFVWHSGSLATDPVIAGATTQNLTQQNGGNYTLVVTRTDLACVSAPVTATVVNGTVLPALTTSTTPSTNCAPALVNGVAQVLTVDGSAVGTVTNYGYQWYTGAGTGSPILIGTNPTTLSARLNNVQGGAANNYTVQVTNTNTGCQNTATVNVADGKVLPIVSLAKIDNGICSPGLTSPPKTYSGQITASITNQVGLLTDYSFVFGAGMGPGVQTANVYDQLNGGATAYTAVATHVPTGCVSSLVSQVISNVLNLPVLTTSSTGSTNCAVGKEDGKANIVTVDGVAVGSATGYTYSWAGPVAPAFAVNTVTNTSNTASLIKVQGGAGYNYTATVTNQNNGCQATAVVNVADSKVLPIVSLAKIDNGICSPGLTSPPKTYSGQITASITNQVGLLTDYSFVFGAGMGPGVQTANVYDQLNGGATGYTAVATHVPTGCVSSLVSQVVSNVLNLPVLTTSSTGSTNCAVGKEDGKADIVTVDGVAVGTATGYTYSWAGPVAPAFAVNTVTNTSNTASLIKVQGGAGYNYTATVTNLNNGCQTTTSVNVTDLKAVPTFNLTAQPNTICDKTLAVSGAFDGQVQATVNAVGNYASSVPGDFSFTWNTGLTGVGQSLLANVDVGTYSVTALHTNTGCSSVLQSAIVTSAKVLPTITVASTASQNCPGGAADGIASVTNVSPNLKHYDYRWFDGNSTTGAPGPVTLNSTLTTNDYLNVQGGVSGASILQYTVEVTILESGCVNTASVGVADDSQLPQLGALVANDNTFCVGADGSAALSTLTYRTVAQSAPYPGFTFNWSNGDTSPNTTTPLSAGAYTLTVTNTGDNCTSNPVSVTIADNQYIPVINITEVPQTSCDPLNPNGKLSAAVDETSIGGAAAESSLLLYDFNWSGGATGTTAQISNLDGNLNYTVKATRRSTGCFNTQSALLTNSVTVPTVTLVANAQVVCAPPDGSVAATVAQTPTQTYTFYWLKEQPLTVTTNPNTVITAVNTSSASPNRKFTSGVGATTDTDPQLSYGDYTLVVVDNYTACVSQPQTISVGNNTNSTIVFNPTSFPSSCGTTDGAFDMNATRNDLTATTFTFDVHRGGPTNAVSPINFYSNPPTFNAGLDVAPFPFTRGPVASGVNVNTAPIGIASDIYSVVVTDGFGCKSLQTFFLPFTEAQGVSAVIADSKLCPYTVGDGSINAGVVVPPPPSPVTTPDQYIIRLYSGANPLPANLIGGPSSQVAPAYTAIPFASLAPGFYTVEIEQNFGSHCKVYQVEEIKALSLPPAISLASTIIANDACVSNFNGRIDLAVAKDPLDTNPGAVTYDILLNAAAFQTTKPPGTYPATNLAPGSYQFDVTASTGCKASRTYTIDDEPVVAQLVSGDVLISNAQYCDQSLEQSAKVVISNVKIPGGANENLVDYKFEWFSDAALTSVVYAATAGNPAPLTGGDEFINQTPLPASGTVPAGTVTVGDYYVRAVKFQDTKGSGGVGCTTAPFTINILDKSKNPDIVLTPNSNTSCDPTFFEGSINVKVTTASGPGVGSTYDYSWVPNGLPASGAPTNSFANSGANNLQTSIKEGNYSLTATSNTTGCSSTLSTSIVRDTPPVFTLSATPKNLDTCGPFNGNVIVTAVQLDGVAGAIADFDFVWFEADPNTASVLDGTLGPVSDKLNLASFPAIALDKYYVKSVRKAGSGPGAGCASAFVRKDILDDRVYPQISMSSVSSTACDNNFDGRITVTASTASGPGAGANYNFVWTNDPDGLAGPLYSAANALGVASPYTTLNTDKIGAISASVPGQYDVRVTNTVTQCFVDGSVDVTETTIPMLISGVTSTDVDVCAPLAANGTGTVVGITQVPGPGATANYTFTWDTNSSMTTPFVINNPLVTQSNLNIGTYYVTAKRNAVVSPATPGVSGSGCVTPPVSFNVLDKRVTPTISFATVSNTSCDTNFDGKITVTASTASGPGAGAGYSFVWTNDPDGAGALYSAANSAANTASPYSTLSTDKIGAISATVSGQYDIRVTNFVTKCFVDGSTQITKSTIPMTITNVTSTHVDVCAPLAANGSGTITGITETPGPGATASYTFTWDTSPLMTTPFVTNNPALTQGSLNVGTYYVTALRNAVVSPAVAGVSGSGCVTPPISFMVLDKRVTPTISFATVASTSCDNNFDGKITVTANTASGPGLGANYDFVWTSDPDGLLVGPVTVSSSLNTASPRSTGVGDVVGPGDYAMRVTNVVTKCFVDGGVTLLSNPPTVEILTVSKTDQLTCNPGGSVTVGSLTSGVVGNYTYQWFLGDPTTAALQDGLGAVITVPSLVSGAGATQYPAMGSGTYFVQARKNGGVTPGSGCQTPPFRMDVKDLHVDPTVTLSFTPNSSCDPLNPNGTLLANASEKAGPTGDTYSFAWTLNAAALPLVTTQTNTTNTSQLAKAAEGTYVVAIKNLTGTGCSATGSIVVNLNQDISKPNIINVSTVNPLDCLASGSAQVLSISVGGGPAIVGAPLAANFTYEWYQNTFTPGSLIAGQTAPQLNNINPGAYFVLVKEVTTQCKSLPREVDIDNKSIVYPQVEITQTAKQISCRAAIGTAALLGLADGQNDTNAAYKFTWYNNLTLTVPVFASTSTISNLKTGDYSLSVLNTTTGCSASAVYIVPDESPAFTPAPSVTGDPRTLCVGLDGAVLIRVVNIDPSYPFPYNFTADLYNTANADPATPPTFANLPKVIGSNTSFIKTGLDIGFYTGKITDNNTGCFSTANTEIKDLRTKPVIAIVQDNPMTNCDPTIANGQLSATADGGKVQGFGFQWYAGATIPPAGATVATLNKLIGFTAGPYVVHVVNNATGCFDDKSGTITDATVKPFAPSASVVFDRTNCVNPNGWVTANVNGSLLYHFNWYDGSTVKTKPDFNDVDYTGLDIGPYTVTATDPVTGCVSPPSTVSVKDKRITPVFNLTSTPSYCLDSGRDAVGTVSLQLTNNDVFLDHVVWNQAGSIKVVGTGSEVSGLYPGFYDALATTTEGCTATGQVEVRTEISPFNGISLNGDNKNDFFIIDCISLFPNNNVKIFNRNGIKVFEANGYNNADIIFKGIGELGIYSIGNQLPDGTYYYVIDKRDGSKPVSGFLELLR